MPPPQKEESRKPRKRPDRSLQSGKRNGDPAVAVPYSGLAVPYLVGMESAGRLLQKESVRRLAESHERIVKCLGMLTDEQIWKRPNGNVVSVGNLVLHLCGNVGQWVIATLGRSPDLRDRDAEFDATGPVAREQLLLGLESTVAEASKVIMGLNERELEHPWKVQGYVESGVGILVHVVEHFSYHTGQISLHTKLLLDTDLGYYAGQDLTRHG